MKFFLLPLITLHVFIDCGEAKLNSLFVAKRDTEFEERRQQSHLILENIFKSATPCECIENSCSCQFTFFVNDPLNTHQGRIMLENDYNDSVVATLKVGDKEQQERLDVFRETITHKRLRRDRRRDNILTHNYTKSQSNSRLNQNNGQRNHSMKRIVKTGTDLPPLCVPLPQFPIIQLCIVFYDVRLNQDQGVHICLSLEGQAMSTTLAAISFDCITLSPSSVDLVSPDQSRPSFVQAHVGSVPKITFFNKVSVGLLPTPAPPPFIAQDPALQSSVLKSWNN